MPCLMAPSAQWQVNVHTGLSSLLRPVIRASRFSPRWVSVDWSMIGGRTVEVKGYELEVKCCCFLVLDQYAHLLTGNMTEDIKDSRKNVRTFRVRSICGFSTGECMVCHHREWSECEKLDNPWDYFLLKTSCFFTLWVTKLNPGREYF